VTANDRAMVFEWGTADSVSSRTMRADNYALSEETKRLRDPEQAQLTDSAYQEALRLPELYRAPLDRIANALLERETLVPRGTARPRPDVQPESRAAGTVGIPRVVASGSSSAPGA
jgi:ATP-dependent Zn protease